MLKCGYSTHAQHNNTVTQSLQHLPSISRALRAKSSSSATASSYHHPALRTLHYERARHTPPPPAPPSQLLHTSVCGPMRAAPPATRSARSAPLTPNRDSILTPTSPAFYNSRDWKCNFMRAQRSLNKLKLVKLQNWQNSTSRNKENSWVNPGCNPL